MDNNRNQNRDTPTRASNMDQAGSSRETTHRNEPGAHDTGHSQHREPDQQEHRSGSHPKAQEDKAAHQPSHGSGGGTNKREDRGVREQHRTPEHGRSQSDR